MTTFGLGLLPDRPLSDLARAADWAESAGIDAIWVPDERFFRDVYPTLTAIASATSTVQLGPCVTDPFVRHPALTAMAVGTLQEVSGGRAALGIGAGISGFAALGISQQHTAPTIREGVALIRSLLADGKADVDGRIIRFRGRLDFQATSVPIYIAGRGPRVLELAGEVGDGVIIGALASEEGLRYASERIAAGARKVGRAPEAIRRILWLHTYVAEEGARAHLAARRIILAVLQSSRPILSKIGVKLSPQLAELVDNAPYGYHFHADESVWDLIPESLVPTFTAAGSPDEVCARIREISARGIDHVVFRLWTVEEQTQDEALGLLLDRVLPLLRESAQ
jgi:5,10-methylenetetrahydromethanopterin reductase